MSGPPAGTGAEARIPNLALVLDLLEWLGDRGRPYAEVMSAWRTSCPRLSIWEDAIAIGLLRCAREPGTTAEQVVLTAEGRRVLGARGDA
jgi:hypothetical protein